MHHGDGLIPVFLLYFSLPASETIIDNQFGYSLFLPDNWAREIVTDSRHRFVDTSGTYQSIVAIVKYDFSSATVYTSAADWTRANFIAYAFTVDADPFSSLVFYDTVTAKRNDSLQATDAFSVYYETDPAIGDWAEYVRYSALGTTGYEIYALGPLDDMEANVGYYAAIIDGMVIIGSSNAAVIPRTNIPSLHPSLSSPVSLDLLGRTIGRKALGFASQIIITRNRPTGVIR